MKFLNQPTTDLTYSDVFLVPSRSDIVSRMHVDISATDGTGSRIPLVASNMNAVTGRRMAETLARRGGLAVLPQDLPVEEVIAVADWMKTRHPIYESALWVTENARVLDVMHLSQKRNHSAVAVISDPEGERLLRGVVRVDDIHNVDHFTSVTQLMRPAGITFQVSDLLHENHDDSSWSSPVDSLRSVYDTMHDAQANYAPVLDGQKLLGVLTLEGVLRSTLYEPNTNSHGQLRLAVAIGINGDVRQKAEELVVAGVDVLVIDTAHGHQQKMIEAIQQVKDLGVPIVAGNVVSAAGVNDLIDAGADIIKVGVGPGAMCTTRMMTAVGRPQFSAVLECAAAAAARGKHVWADGGVKHPRDVALALAAGASQVMIGSWFAGTLESPGDLFTDHSGRRYKENFGMASARAVTHRTRADSAYDRARKAIFEEGVSGSKMFLDEDKPSVENLVDSIIAGVRSSMTYAGAKSLNDFADRAIVGIQSAAGYEEGRPVAQSW